MKLCRTCLVCYEDDVLSCLDETHQPLISPRFGTCTIDGKYRLIRMLERGGMGAVYEGIHLELERARAIKILRPEYISVDPHARWRLRQEALTACNFDHPNLVRLHDFGTNVVSIEEKGRVHAYDEQYIVMELLRGHSLKEVLVQSKRLELQKAISIALQIAEGLAEIHSKGIVYRDLKPANVFICSDYKGDLLVKIVDFGAVKLRDKSLKDGDLDLTKAMFVGSPVYASPENCKGEPLDERSDIYGLGLILYEMIAGSGPFEEGDFLTLLNSHAYIDPRPITGVPQNIADLIMRSLRKNPVDRPQTAREFTESLRSLDLRIMSNVIENETAVVKEEHGCDDTIFGIAEGVEETVVQHRQNRPLTKMTIPTARASSAFSLKRKIITFAAIVLTCLTQISSVCLLHRADEDIPAVPITNVMFPSMAPSTLPRPVSLVKALHRISPSPVLKAVGTPVPAKSKRDSSYSTKPKPPARSNKGRNSDSVRRGKAGKGSKKGPHVETRSGHSKRDNRRSNRNTLPSKTNRKAHRR